MAIVQDDHDVLVCPKCLAVFRAAFRACPRDGATLTTTSSDPLVGTVVAERYQIEGLLGEGGVGRVYKARHTRMSRRFALKVPYGELAYDPKVRARFANEAEAASRLSHPNVIGVVDFGETATGLLYMAMDYAEGRSLAAVIADNGALDRDWVLRFTRAIALGLAHAHDRGLVHRDLKPDNIIVERDGDRPRIVDFGLAIFREQDGGRMTTEGTVLGTPHYMAPEQATGQDIDQRTDLFALGLCMYEMLAGVLPFDGTPIEVARKNLLVPVPPIAERVPGLHVDPDLEAVCNHLVAKRPEDRPPNAHVVIDQLARLERGDASTAPVSRQVQAAPPAEPAPARNMIEPEPVPAALPAARPPTSENVVELATGRRRRLVVLAGVVVVGIAAVIGWRLVRDQPATESAPADAAALGMVAVDARPAAATDASAVVAAADAAPVSGPDARSAIVVARKVDARIAFPPDARAVAVAVDARVAAPAVDAAPPPQTTVTALYKQVRAAIDKLEAAKGEPAARAFRNRWSEVPYMDGMGNPALRVDLIKRLRDLEREVAAAMK